MNILREVRRVNQKSMPARIILLLSFSVIFIVTTYAWFTSQKNVTLGGLEGKVTSWDVAYYVNSDTNQILDQIATFEIQELYPGMPNRQDDVHIYNIGKASSRITYELQSVKLFGNEILDQLNIVGPEEVTITDENDVEKTVYKTTIFAGDTDYPFVITYTYDKTKLVGKYEIGGEYEDSAQATLNFNVSWAYELEEEEEQSLAKDVLDTQFGKDAYSYYNSENGTTNAIEIKVKITSSMIHPSVDRDYPYGDY